jgi:hypothetical protein
VEQEISKLGGSKYLPAPILCTDHWNGAYKKKLVTIFLYLYMYDEMIRNPKIQDMAIQLESIDKAFEVAGPWCCFLGAAKTTEIYNKIYAAQAKRNPNQL